MSDIVVQLLYRGSYPVLLLGFYFSWKMLRKSHFFLFVILFVGTVLFAWARFIEPQQIVVQESVVDIGISTKIVLISDIHAGAFKDQRYLERVVSRINTIPDVEAVLIAGDFLHRPHRSQSLGEIFTPLKNLSAPTYAVLGNHDVGLPGKDLRLPLIKALEENNVNFLNNDIVDRGERLLVGLGSHMAGDDDVSILEGLENDDKVVVLTHNPDTVLRYENGIADLTVVGHTHCGQIRPPFLYSSIKKSILPVQGDFDCGRTQEEYGQLFITPGLGEVGLPMRFGNPPTVDVLYL